MNTLIEKLKELSQVIPLEENYIWDIPATTPLAIPPNIVNNYQKNIYLKENLSQHLNNDPDLTNHYWVIQDWGGIRSFKKNERNDKRINEFKSQIKDGELKKNTFNLISSLSKIASFLRPNDYAIYDSRAIYSLNWLLFRYSQKKELYVQPPGRSAKLTKYDMQTIIRLTNNGYTYKSHKVAYHDYCKLLKTLSYAVYEDDNPYNIEMLLFLAAPTEIIDDIKSSVQISVN